MEVGKDEEHVEENDLCALEWRISKMVHGLIVAGDEALGDGLYEDLEAICMERNIMFMPVALPTRRRILHTHAAIHRVVHYIDDGTLQELAFSRQLEDGGMAKEEREKVGGGWVDDSSQLLAGETFSYD